MVRQCTEYCSLVCFSANNIQPLFYSRKTMFVYLAALGYRFLRQHKKNITMVFLLGLYHQHKKYVLVLCRLFFATRLLFADCLALAPTWTPLKQILIYLLCLSLSFSPSSKYQIIHFAITPIGVFSQLIHQVHHTGFNFLNWLGSFNFPHRWQRIIKPAPHIESLQHIQHWQLPASSQTKRDHSFWSSQ